MSSFLQPLLAGLFILPACNYTGIFATYLKFPKITGYLIAGVIAGPYVLRLLTEKQVSDLRYLDQCCLSLIALAAGSELKLSDLQKQRKQVIWVTLGIVGITWILIYFPLIYLADVLGLKKQFGEDRLLVAVITLAATLMGARSPAAAIAVLKELQGKGPFCGLVMAVVVVKDVFVVVAFSINLELVRSMFNKQRSYLLEVMNLIEPVISVASAVIIGLILAVFLVQLMKITPVPSRLPKKVLHVAMLLVVSCTGFYIAHFFNAEPLLACVTIGMVAQNMGVDEEPHEQLTESLTEVMPYVNLVFFSLAGSSIRLNQLQYSVLAAAVIYFLRLLGVIAGSQLGGYLSGVSLIHRQLMWGSMITQAGVALGLSRMVVARFPDWGPNFHTLMVSVIIFNQLSGPPLFKRAINKVGEGYHSRKEASQVDKNGFLIKSTSTYALSI
eukprot:TRINITY_DN8157_c0_g2_i1.p1 TRINITY_DN8157_c0_g2~~TRINITY_DN8157_c0_g2_i1.p1  ORF type:complete len:450 (-),score=28.01 TRINITY_DN8157_c0_g2_i1:352-1677(-)